MPARPSYAVIGAGMVTAANLVQVVNKGGP